MIGSKYKTRGKKAESKNVASLIETITVSASLPKTDNNKKLVVL